MEEAATHAKLNSPTLQVESNQGKKGGGRAFSPSFHMPFWDKHHSHAQTRPRGTWGRVWKRPKGQNKDKKKKIFPFHLLSQADALGSTSGYFPLGWNKKKEDPGLLGVDDWFTRLRLSFCFVRKLLNCVDLAVCLSSSLFCWSFMGNCVACLLAGWLWLFYSLASRSALLFLNNGRIAVFSLLLVNVNCTCPIVAPHSFPFAQALGPHDPCTLHS